MTSHIPHGTPDDRESFLVDGCPRCEQYVDELGLPFDPERFRAFWLRMVEIEWNDRGAWSSTLDKRLGRKLYFVTLAMQRAYGFDPALLPIAAMEVDG